MADPTLVMTLETFAIRVAEYLGIAKYNASTSVAELPDASTHDRDLVFRLVNDGYRRFVSANPRWNFLSPVISITTSAGDFDYDMPDNFTGSLADPFTFTSDGPGYERLWEVSEDQIREWQAINGDTWSTTPTHYAIRSKNSATPPRFEVLFWPTPDTAYELLARARLFPNALSSTTDKTVAGFQHDQAVLYAALAEAERQRMNMPNGPMERMFQEQLKVSMLMDREVATRNLGNYGPKCRTAPGRLYTGVDNYLRRNDDGTWSAFASF